jgi:hypothetical protein
MDAVCFGAYRMHEESNLDGGMGMGVSNNRGRQWEDAICVLGGHALGSQWKSPQIC